MTTFNQAHTFARLAMAQPTSLRGTMTYQDYFAYALRSPRPMIGKVHATPKAVASFNRLAVVFAGAPTKPSLSDLIKQCKVGQTYTLMEGLTIERMTSTWCVSMERPMLPKAWVTVHMNDVDELGGIGKAINNKYDEACNKGWATSAKAYLCVLEALVKYVRKYEAK